MTNSIAEIVVMFLCMIHLPLLLLAYAITELQCFLWALGALLIVAVELKLHLFRYWLLYITVKVVGEPEPEDLCVLSGLPLFDPQRGVYGLGLYKGKEVKVIVQPNWWPYLASPDVTNGGGKESAVIGNHYSSVEPKAEPRSLVAIFSSKGSHIGFGSRVKWEGAEYLLTAYHVWTHMKNGFNLSKGGLMVEVSGAILFEGCPQKELDYALVRISAPYWSKLSVGVSPLRTQLQSSCYVKIFGGNSSTALLSSQGRCVRTSTPVRLAHLASTAPGWSGSPLYADGVVVGIHTGFIKYGELNEAFDVAGFLMTRNRKKETAYSEIGMREIELDEMLTRDGKYLEFTLEGENPQNGMLMGHEFTLHKWKSHTGVNWADLPEDDDDDYLPSDFKECSSEFIDQSLNSRGAVPPSELPLPNLRPSTGKNLVSSKPAACVSPTLESRIVALERGNSELKVMLSLQLSEFSQKLDYLAGPREALTLKETPCSSKPVDSDPPPPQPTCKSVVPGSPPSMGKAEQNCVSVKTSSSTKTSSGSKSGKRRSRRRSTAKRAQAPLGLNSAKPMEKSLTTPSISLKKECTNEYLS